MSAIGLLAAAACLAACGDSPLDDDGDGFPVPGDCDDTDPGVHPQAADDPCDGVDSDCDGPDTCDADGDGFPAPAFGGTDCDDADPAVNPDAPRECGNGVDDDCDLAPDCDLRGQVVLEDVVAAWCSGPAGSGLGTAVALGDPDADGALDLLAAAGDLDESFLFRGPLLDERRTDQADGVYAGGSAGVALGDLDGDGRADLATATETTARVWSATTLGVSVPDASFDSSEDEHLVLVQIAPDIGGDGVGDLVLGRWGYPDNIVLSAFSILVFSGPVDGLLLDEGAAALWIDDDLPVAALHADSGSDLTGDGLVDLLVGAPEAYAYVVEAPLPALSRSGDALAVVDSNDPDDGLLPGFGQDGVGVASGDLDGDGLADVVVSLASDTGTPGEVWILHSPLEGVVGRADTLAIVQQVDAYSTAVAGDVNGDGEVDLVMQSSAPDDGREDAEIAYSPRGLVLPDAFVHPAADEDSVTGVAAPGDVDGDGLADLLAAARGSDLGAPGGGAVQLILGLPTGY